MDFNFRKPLHLFALLCLLVSLGLFVALPVYSLFLPAQDYASMISTLQPFQKTVFEMFIVASQLILVFLGMILVPLLWYKLVNNVSLKEMFSRMKLRRAGLQTAFLWGVGAIIVTFAVFLVMGFIYTSVTGVNSEDVGNIPDLVKLFSVPSLYLIVIVQPFCEEFFFRGFLLDKITGIGGTPLAILSTALLFGISHLTYTYAYTAVAAVMLGLIFAVVVVKTKNLYSTIFAHTVINIASLTLYFLGKAVGY